MGGGLSDGGRALTRCGEAAEAPVSGSAPPGVDHSSTCVCVCVPVPAETRPGPLHTHSPL